MSFQRWFAWVLLVLLPMSCTSDAAGPTIVFLLDVSPSTDPERGTCRAAFVKVLQFASDSSAHLAVETISRAPLQESHTPIAFDFSSLAPQERDTTDIRLSLLQQFDAIPPASGGSAVFEGFRVADRILARRATDDHTQDAYLVVCSDLLNNTSDLNLLKHRMTDIEIERVLSTWVLRGDVPRWGGVRVYVVGPGQGRRIVPLPDGRLASIQRLYERYFAKAGATLVSFESTLRSFP